MYYSILLMTCIVCLNLNSQDNNKQVEQSSIQNQDLIRLELSKQRRAEQYEAIIGQIAESSKAAGNQKPK